MKVFLSWSGELSHGVALTLRDWLPCVINVCEPYVSSADIDKGARWSTDIAKALDECSFGILCVTADNVTAPWLNFEAGALSKHVEKAQVCPFLYGVKKAEVAGPLLQFQLTSAEKEDFYKLLATLNKVAAPLSLPEQNLNYVFAKLWPDLEARLTGLSTALPTNAVKRNAGAHEILEEILELARFQQKYLRSPEMLLPPEYIATLVSRFSSSSVAGVPHDYPAWRELQIAIDAANVALKRFAEGQSVKSDEVQAVVSRIIDPAEVLLRKTREMTPGRQ
jgi:hypothetical protein